MEDKWWIDWLKWLRDRKALDARAIFVCYERYEERLPTCAEFDDIWRQNSKGYYYMVKHRYMKGGDY